MVLNRRRLLTGLIAAPLVMSSDMLMPLRGVKLYMPSPPRSTHSQSLLDEMLKFANTPYLERMDLGQDYNGNNWGPGHQIYDILKENSERLSDTIIQVRRQIEEFKVTEPFTTSDKVGAAFKERQNNLYLDISGKHPILHDRKLRHIIKDAMHVNA